METENGFKVLSNELMTELERIREGEVPEAAEQYVDDIMPVCGALAEHYKIAFVAFQRAASTYVLPVKQQVDEDIDEADKVRRTLGQRTRART